MNYLKNSHSVFQKKCLKNKQRSLQDSTSNNNLYKTKGNITNKNHSKNIRV